MIIKKEELMKKQGSSIELSDGMYSAALVGYLVAQREPFNEKGEPYNAVRFAFQLEDDAGNIKCVQTPDYRLSFSEKSNFYKQLASWSKASSPDDLWSRMEQAGFINGDDFSLDKFLGMHIGLMTAMKASKKDASKLYPEFTWVPAKKNALFEPQLSEDGKNVPLWISDFIEDDQIIEFHALKGFEWKRYEEKQDEPEATIGKSSRKQNNSEPEEGIPEENVKPTPAPTSTPKLKVRTRKAEEEIDF